MAETKTDRGAAVPGGRALTAARAAQYMAERMAMRDPDEDQEQNWILGHLVTFAEHVAAALSSSLAPGIPVELARAKVAEWRQQALGEVVIEAEQTLTACADDLDTLIASASAQGAASAAQVDLHAIAKDASERAATNSGASPQLLYAPILWALQEALSAASVSPPAPQWRPIESAPTDEVVDFWIVPKLPDESYTNTSGEPIAHNCAPRRHTGKLKTWGATWKATHWKPVDPLPPRPPRPRARKVRE